MQAKPPLQASHSVTRRKFIKHSAVATSLTLAVPNLLTASKTQSETIIGEGEYQYRVHHDCVKLPSEFHWQTTHNVAVDSAGLLYVIHEGNKQLKDHPAIFVFDVDGKYIRSFGMNLQGGGHGLEVRKEGNEEFLYITTYLSLKFFAKLTLLGDTVWERHAPMESNRYAEGEATTTAGDWGRNRFMPTNISFLDNGSFYVADGYGAWCVHHYDADAKYLSSFGSEGSADGQFSLPHGIWTDNRIQGEPTLVVADRSNNRLQWFSIDGKHLKTMGDFIQPANLDTYGDLLLVPELGSRISLLDSSNQVVARLGDDAKWRDEVGKDNNKLRTQPERWAAGRFIHPHDACFDADGNIYVAEWVATGRITKLERIV